MKDQKRFDLLSPREQDVVDLLLEGRSNKQIGLGLGISERTVEFHLNNIYGKFQVASRVELILKLEKAASVKSENPVESTVVFREDSADNGNQTARVQAAQAWSNLVTVVKREIAMTMKISFEDMEDYLRGHPDVLSLLVFLAASVAIRYVVYSLGLYIGASYLLLELLLIFAGVRFGELLNGTWRFRALPTIVIAGMLPLLVAGFDQLCLITVLRFTDSVSVSLPFLCTTAEWVTSPDGNSYLSTQLNITSDFLWFAALAEMFGAFLLTRMLGKRPGKSNLAPA